MWPIDGDAAVHRLTPHLRRKNRAAIERVRRVAALTPARALRVTA
jgi:hypothetical protein